MPKPPSDREPDGNDETDDPEVQLSGDAFGIDLGFHGTPRDDESEEVEPIPLPVKPRNKTLTERLAGAKADRSRNQPPAEK